MGSPRGHGQVLVWVLFSNSLRIFLSSLLLGARHARLVGLVSRWRPGFVLGSCLISSLQANCSPDALTAYTIDLSAQLKDFDDKVVGKMALLAESYGVDECLIMISHLEHRMHTKHVSSMCILALT